MTVVLFGDVRLTCKSPIQVWLIASPTMSKSDIAPMPLTLSVDVTTPGEPPEKSGIALGTSVEAGLSWHGGVAVGVAVEVPVIVGLGVEVPHEPPIVSLMS